MSISLKNKILIGFIVNILVVLTMGWISFERIQNRVKLSELDTKHLNILLSTTRGNILLISNENLAKSYVLTGDETAYNKLDESRKTSLIELATLSSLLQDDPEQKKRMETFQGLVGKRLLVIDQFLAIGKLHDIGRAVNYLKDKNTLKVIDEVADLLNQIQKEENKLYDQKRSEILKRAKLLVAVFNALLISTILLLIVVYMVIRFQMNAKKNAELMAANKDKLVRSIIDNTNSPIFIKSISGQYLLANKQFQKLFNKKEEELVGRTDRDIYPGEIADKLQDGDVEIIRGQEQKTYEEQFTSDNLTRNYLVTKFPIIDQNNSVYALGGIATDITEKAKVDMAERERAVQFQTIWDSAPDAIIIIDEDGKIIRWNPKAKDIFGWSFEEIKGKLMYEVIMPLKYRDKHMAGFSHFIETGEGPIMGKSIEVVGLNKNKNEFDIELSISAAKLKDKYIFIAFIREITERKMMEKKVVESEKFLNTIIENIPDIVFVKDPLELRYLRLNLAAEKWMGVPREELLNKNNYDLFPKEQADFFTKTDMQILSTGELVDIAEEDASTKLGKRILHTKKIPIKDENGRPAFLLGISEDITDKKRLELEKIEADRMLQQNAQQVALILENIGEGVIVVDKDQRLLLSNQKAADVVGIRENQKKFSSLDLVNKYEIFYADGKTTFPSQELPLTKALRGEQTTEVELVIRDLATMEERHVIVYGAPILNQKGEIVAGVTTIKDITGLKELATELNLSEGKFRNLIGYKRTEAEKQVEKSNVLGYIK